MKIVEELQTDAIYTINDNRLNSFINNVVNVKSYGALGDGKTDDSEAILRAISNLDDNSMLYFPQGDYIVYNDYVDNHNEFGYDYEKLIKISNLKNIAIIGESKENTTIRPSYQQKSNAKLNYPCTLSIIDCKNVSVKNITIESKGESYGDSDSITFEGGSENRKKALACNGGQAILLLNSDRVFIDNVNSRICGSVGVIYSCNSNDVFINNTFTNAMSLGYAGICQDMFFKDGAITNRVYVNNVTQFAERIYQNENKLVLKGSDIYSGKCCFLNEGSEISKTYSYLNNLNIRDCYGGGPDFADGYAIGCSSAFTFINNVNIEDCYYAISLRSNFNGFKTIARNINAKVKTAGLFIREDVNNNSGIELTDSYLECDGSFTNNNFECTKYGSAVCSKAYQGKEIKINNCTLKGSQIAVYTPEYVKMDIQNCLIIGNQAIISKCGIFNIKGNNIMYQEDDSGVQMDTKSVSGIAGELELSIENNHFIGNNNNCIKILNSHGGSLIKYSNIKQNTEKNCYLNGLLTTVGINDCSEIVNILSTGQSEDKYYLEFNPNWHNISHNIPKIILNDGSIAVAADPMSSYNNNFRIYFSTDIRRQVTIGKNYLLLY